MLPQIKHNRVNWQDGMKISRSHFIQMENALEDQIRDMTGTYLTNFNYGLLTPGPNSRQSLDIQLFYDRSDQITVKVIECRAITPGGARIEILPGNQPVEATILNERLKTQAYEIYVVVDPFTRMPSGQPDPKEVPLRQPFTLSHYRLEILPYPQTHQPEYGGFQLCIGRLQIDGESVKLSEHYIPPCTSLMSHPRLIASHRKLLTQLGEAEIAATGIIQRIHAKPERTALDESLLYLTEKIIDFTGHTLDNFRLLAIQQPPIYLTTYFASFARVINIGLNSLVRKHREELLDYFHKWFELAPREMENMLRTLLVLSYDHNDTFAGFNKVELFADRIIVLLKKLNELNYVDKPVELEKIYGWLILHTEGRRRSIYKIKGRSLLIGRQEADNNDIDFIIPDDTWVSRKHAKLSVQEDKDEIRFQLVDMNSVNGTYIHDTQTRLKPNEEFSLIDGDTFQIGKTNIVLISSLRTPSEKEALEQIEKTPFQKIENITNPVTM